MIKANELMLGNKIFSKQDDSILNVVQIDDLGCVIENENGNRWIEFEHLYPVQITEEWLLKAGCSDKNHHTLDLKAKRKTIVFNWFSKVVATGKRSGFYSKKYRHIKYIHQLQNLYFALTDVELVFSTEP